MTLDISGYRTLRGLNFGQFSSGFSEGRFSGRSGVVKLGAVQPASLEAVPEQDRIHLPGELVNPPNAVVLNHFAGRIERQAVQPAECVNFIPVLRDIAVF